MAKSGENDDLKMQITALEYRARLLTEWWRDHYNRIRPHSSLGYRSPSPEVVMDNDLPVPESAMVDGPQ